MIMKANKQIGFIYKNNESIDKILKDGDVVFERGFLRERTSTTLPITFGGVGKDLKDYKAYGNTYQNSTTGKNLLNYVDNILSSTSGLTNVINDDGSITTTGVPTSNYAGILTQHDIIDKLEDGQTYTISSETQNQYVYIQINAVKIAGGTDYIYNSNSRVVQFTVNKSKYSKYNLKIQVGTTSAWGTNSRTITNKYQLEKGGTATDFEPYTGGQPSPNPDYPQEIISCGDRTRNLFDKVNATYKNGYYKNDNGAEQSTQTSGYLTSYIQVKPNTIYTIQGSLKQTNQSSQSYAIYYYNINKQWISRTVTTDNPPYTFTTPNDCYFIQFQYRQDVYDENTIQIEEGTTATSYEPYGYKIPVNVRSDNLFDKDNYEYITAYLSSSNIITNSGNAVSFYIKCKPNTTYNVSKTSLFGNDRFCLFDTSSLPTVGDIALSYAGTKTGNDNNKDLTITTNAAAQYLCIFVKASPTAPSASIQDIANTLQIVEGSTVPSKYIPYYNETTNIYLDKPLRKSLNNIYTDYIDFANQKIIRRNGISVINVDNITLKSNYTNVEYASSPKPSDFIGYNSYSAQPTFCSHATYLFNPSNYDSKNNVDKFITGPEKGNWWIGFPKGTGLTEIKSKLDGCEFVYILATPTEETITLPDIPTIDGNNTLNIETEITPSQVYIKYKSNT